MKEDYISNLGMLLGVLSVVTLMLELPKIISTLLIVGAASTGILLFLVTLGENQEDSNEDLLDN